MKIVVGNGLEITIKIWLLFVENVLYAIQYCMIKVSRTIFRCCETHGEHMVSRYLALNGEVPMHINQMVIRINQHQVWQSCVFIRAFINSFCLIYNNKQ